MTFKIAIVGRPNVGKSTLFNRLVGRKLAIVHNTPGVTRDWQEAPANLFGHHFMAIDTAGLDDGKGDELARRMSKQSQRAIDQADLIWFVVDGKVSLQNEDRTIAKELRKSGKPIFLVINKCENKTGQDWAEFHRLGFNPAIPVSAEHGLGMDELAAYLEDYCPAKQLVAEKDEWEAEETEEVETEEKSAKDRRIKLAIVGKPNAGKSTLINQMVGEERLLTGPEAGITRDAIAVPFEWRGKKLELVDTAGLRKKAKVVEKLEQMATSDTINAINMAEVVLLVLDVSQGITRQDLTIADLAANEGRAVAIVINKWDLVRDKGETINSVKAIVEKSLPQIADAPIIYISALQSKNLDKVFKAVFEVYDVWNKRISTSKLNNWLKKMVEAYPPPMVKNKRLKLRYATQIKTRPPTFVLFCNGVYDMPDSYIRYITNKMRDEFDMPGTPIRIYLRQGENPYTKE
ncbi:MAG: ribosome biogenesis GTPase Der [Alphaproteobacteria bacterium]|nr:MAG: ribosome biogenesis GTPase Der [Alphaproteobacteria bacterium]